VIQNCKGQHNRRLSPVLYGANSATEQNAHRAAKADRRYLAPLIAMPMPQPTRMTTAALARWKGIDNGEWSQRRAN
jgi:hypothetical protein